MPEDAQCKLQETLEKIHKKVYNTEKNYLCHKLSQ